MEKKINIVERKEALIAKLKLHTGMGAAQFARDYKEKWPELKKWSERSIRCFLTNSGDTNIPFWNLICGKIGEKPFKLIIKRKVTVYIIKYYVEESDEVVEVSGPSKRRLLKNRVSS